MCVRVDESGHDGSPREVDPAGASGREVQDVFIGSDGENAFARDSDGLSPWIRRIDRVDIRSVENQIGFDSPAAHLLRAENSRKPCAA